MQTPATEFWWAYGAGTVVLLAITLAFLATLVSSQKKMRTQLKRTKASEAKYRALFENSLVGMIRIAIPGFHVVDSNQTFRDSMGTNSAGEILDCFRSAGHADLEELEKNLVSKEHLEDVEIRMRSSDGSLRWISLTCRLHRGEGSAEGIVVDITGRKQAEEKLRESHRQLRSVSARLESIREEERMRIARQVHDELGQILTGIKMHLTVMTDALAGREQRSRKSLQKLGDLIDIIDDAIDLVKNISQDLRPLVLEDLGFKEAVEWEASQFEQKTGIECRVRSEGNVALAREHATAVFRILQEALTNVVRHASADSVDIRMKAQNGSFILEVADNGKGIRDKDTTNPKALGLLGMKERAMFLGGDLRIARENGRGTLVGLTVPMTSADPFGA